MHHAEMNSQLQEVSHYQRVQQLTLLTNDTVRCIGIRGAIATNEFRGGSSILNDFQVCRLVGKSGTIFHSYTLLPKCFGRFLMFIIVP